MRDLGVGCRQRFRDARIVPEPPKSRKWMVPFVQIVAGVACRGSAKAVIAGLAEEFRADWAPSNNGWSLPLTTAASVKCQELPPPAPPAPRPPGMPWAACPPLPCRDRCGLTLSFVWRAYAEIGRMPGLRASGRRPQLVGVRVLGRGRCIPRKRRRTNLRSVPAFALNGFLRLLWSFRCPRFYGLQCRRHGPMSAQGEAAGVKRPSRNPGFRFD